MSTTTWVVGTGALVAAGRWANNQPITVNIAVGVGVYSIALALIQNASQPLANNYAVAVFVLACFRYLPGIVQKLGWTGGAR